MLTIGEFAKRGHVSARMLRHYDMLGLLRPAHTGLENGYRYYGETQLDVLRRIEALKAYGFKLSEICALLALPQAELSQRLHERRLRAYEELARQRRVLATLEEDIAKMEGARFMQEQYEVAVMQAPAQRVYGLRKTINIAEVHELFAQLRREAEEKGLARAGCTQLVYHGEQFDYDNMEVEAQMEVLGEGEGVRELPAGTFIATTHTGPYESVHFAYDALCAWLEQNPGYSICGPGIERYIVDETNGVQLEQYQTGVLFPVHKTAP